jgi:hypothetical protein
MSVPYLMKTGDPPDTSSAMCEGIYTSGVRSCLVSPAGGDREVFGRGDSIPVPAILVAVINQYQPQTAIPLFLSESIATRSIRRSSVVSGS